MECACGCREHLAPLRRPGRPERTFRPGHHRRVQGRLLADLAAGRTMDRRLLKLYTEPATRFTDVLTPDPAAGKCMCGCGTTTGAVYAPGHGYRFSDAMLRSLAGHNHRFTIPIGEVVTIWHDRQRQSPKAAERASRYSRRSAS